MNLRYLSLEDRRIVIWKSKNFKDYCRGPAGGLELSDVVDQLNDLIQRHEMDTANVPNVEEAETKGKTAEKPPETSNTAAQKIYAVSFTRRKFAQKTRMTSRLRNATKTRMSRRTRSGGTPARRTSNDSHEHAPGRAPNTRILVDVHPTRRRKNPPCLLRRFSARRNPIDIRRIL